MIVAKIQATIGMSANLSMIPLGFGPLSAGAGDAPGFGRALKLRTRFDSDIQ